MVCQKKKPIWIITNKIQITTMLKKGEHMDMSGKIIPMK